MSSIVLATLALNEMEWLEKLYQQHRHWKGLVRWIFVESADRIYAECNPDMVTSGGLSTDGTTQFLQSLSSVDDRVVHIKHGFCGDGLAKDQGKCEARNRYLEVCEDIKPDYLIVVDADEFHTYASQSLILNYLNIASNRKRSSIRLKQRHIWYPPFLQEESNKKWVESAGLKMFSNEVIGGYWKVPHTRIWGWEPGIRYRRNHNWPEDTSEVYLTDKPTSICIDRVATKGPVPQCIHMGFAASIKSREAKHKYYQERGEGKELNLSMRGRRQNYVDCRLAWQVWKPSNILPHGARVVPYSGFVPEVFLKERVSCQPDTNTVGLSSSSTPSADHKTHKG
jgi:hypothetical protein